MGVTKLWQLLEEVEEGQETLLSQCHGQSWAVDLSGWILHARTAAFGKAGLSADPTMIRTVFSRALCLMKHGIRPVFVMDGRLAPEVKSQTMRDRSERAFASSKMTANDRSGLQRSNNMCQRMLESLGLQVIKSSGEAEKACALLNHQGIVDACLSDDSDSFLYGAKTVYRNLDAKKETVEKHTLSKIEEKLHLSRRDLVVVALLSGCDYGDGVKGIGPKKVVELVTAVKKYSSDVLQRVCDWRDNMDLNSITEEVERVSKSTHCSQCQHTGSKVQHRKNGCTVCESTMECSADSSRPCPCEYHKVHQRAKPYMVELDVRKKAIKLDNFPDKKLVDEFLDDQQAFSIKEVTVSMPKWDDLVEEMGMSHQDLMKKLIPVLIHVHLYGTLELLDTTPESILKACTRKATPCYLVSWKRFAFDKWTVTPVVDVEKTPTKDLEGEDPYVVAVPCQPLEAKYPKLVAQHKLSSSGKKGKKGKRPTEDKAQMKLSDCFKVRKVLQFEDQETF